MHKPLADGLTGGGALTGADALTGGGALTGADALTGGDSSGLAPLFFCGVSTSPAVFFLRLMIGSAGSADPSPSTISGLIVQLAALSAAAFIIPRNCFPGLLPGSAMMKSGRKKIPSTQKKSAEQILTWLEAISIKVFRVLKRSAAKNVCCLKCAVLVRA